MESKGSAVWNNAVRVKAEQSAESAIRIDKSKGVFVSKPSGLSALVNKLRKRKRVDGCEGKCGPCLRKSSLICYTNFMKSSLPRRVLFYQNNEWNDFPPYVVDLAREHFQSKNAAIEVKFNGCHFLLDILYMIQWDVKTGIKKRIAWIDDNDHCFFPDFHFDSTGKCGNAGFEYQPSNGKPDIELQLDVELKGAQSCNLEKCVELDEHPKKIKLEQESVIGPEAVKTSESLYQIADDATDKAFDSTDESATFKPDFKLQTMDYYTVRDMFIKGMKLPTNTDVVEINGCTSNLMKARFELFEKQVQITGTNRGNPNVQYAWLASKRDSLRKIQKYGLGNGAFKSPSVYGLGVHLAAIDHSYISANYCDEDENGIRYVLFCRVILGNSEIVHPGARQFCPSNENYDTGVDNLQNPHYYIVWNMDMNTHILPECIISFKMSSNKRGYLVGDGIREKSRVMIAQDIHGSSELHYAPVVSVKPQVNDVNCGIISERTPKSPYMPFPLLFDAISKEIAPKNMKIVNMRYDLYKNMRITRAEFIRDLRMIVGDKLLRSTIMSLQCKLPPKIDCDVKVPKEEPEW